jgi:hypothetical protein
MKTTFSRALASLLMLLFALSPFGPRAVAVAVVAGRR